jgi:hypothetical protein
MIRAMEADGEVLHIDGAQPIDEVHRQIVGIANHAFNQ